MARGNIRGQEDSMARFAPVLLALAGVAAGCSAPATPPPASTASTPRAFPGGPLVDLSHAYDAQAIFWPTAAPFKLTKVADGVTPGGYYYAANDFATSEHGGTHIDSPIHFAQGHQTVDQIPLERLLGAAVVVDVTEAAAKNADYLVTADDIQKAEARDGRIPDRAIVLLRTGWSKRWPDAATYLGTAERGEAAVAKLHFPGLDPAAAAWLIANRSISAIGIDTASIDYGQSKLFETHRALFAQDIPAFENLTDLDRLPVRGANVVALPMKIAGGSGAPLRVVAILPS
jgi:kynurenine formamidase